MAARLRLSAALEASADFDQHMENCFKSFEASA